MVHLAMGLKQEEPVVAGEEFGAVGFCVAYNCGSERASDG